MKKVTIYLLGWNESALIRMIDAEWKRIFDDCHQIVLLDNESDDGTPEIAKELGWEVRTFSTNGKMDDLTHIRVKESCWKDCQTDWCIVSDFDEITPLKFGRLWDCNIVKCTGYEMFNDKMELDKVTQGVPSVGYSKVTAWKPKDFQHITIKAGQHEVTATPKEGVEIKWNTEEVPLYHFKWVSWEHGIERAHILAKKQSDYNKQMKWSFHFALADEVHKDYYDNGMKNRKVIR